MYNQKQFCFDKKKKKKILTLKQMDATVKSVGTRSVYFLLQIWIFSLSIPSSSVMILPPSIYSPEPEGEHTPS